MKLLLSLLLGCLFQYASAQTADTTTITLDDYTFKSPARWYGQKLPDYILLSQTQSPAERGCVIVISSPTQSSGNLENDAKIVFDELYQGWQYRHTGKEHDAVSKGCTPQGYEFYAIEASMQKPRPDGYYFDYEKGKVITVKAGNRVIVIVARHERGELTCFCDYQYEYWGQFFASFAVKNCAPAKNTHADAAKRLVGSWQSIGGSALVKYIFAANRQYVFIGAYSTSRRINYSTIELSTSGFKGDGSYSIKGNLLTITANNKKNAPEVNRFRLEQVNFGSTGWTDRLYLMGKSVVDGTEYEVRYEKQQE